LVLIYGSVGNSGRCSVQARLGSFLEKVKGKFQVKKKNNSQGSWKEALAIPIPVGILYVKYWSTVPFVVLLASHERKELCNYVEQLTILKVFGLISGL
jgi:hypothetical protein